MTDIHRKDEILIERYLAGRLSDAEALVVETRIVDDPEFRNEVELTEALRDGLQELQRRGELAPLLSNRRTMWQHPRLALAASVAAVALGAASFLFYQRLDVAAGDPAAAVLRFERTRGAIAGPDVEWQRSGAPARLEMLFDVGLEPAAKYRVVVERRAGSAIEPVLATEAALTADGDASVAVDPALFTAGDYRITLTAQPPADPQDPVVYALRIAGQD